MKEVFGLSSNLLSLSAKDHVVLTLKSLLGEAQHTQAVAQDFTPELSLQLCTELGSFRGHGKAPGIGYKPCSQTWSPCRQTLPLGGCMLHFPPCMGGFSRAISCLFPICYREASGGVFATWRSINSEKLFVLFEVWLLPGTVIFSPMGT